MTLNSHHMTATVQQQQATSIANHLQAKGSSTTTALIFVLISTQRHPSCHQRPAHHLQRVAWRRQSETNTALSWAPQNSKQMVYPCHYKAHTRDQSKQDSRSSRVGVKACQTSAVHIQKQKRHQENLLWSLNSCLLKLLLGFLTLSCSQGYRGLRGRTNNYQFCFWCSHCRLHAF